MLVATWELEEPLLHLFTDDHHSALLLTTIMSRVRPGVRRACATKGIKLLTACVIVGLKVQTAFIPSPPSLPLRNESPVC